MQNSLAHCHFACQMRLTLWCISATLSAPQYQVLAKISSDQQTWSSVATLWRIAMEYTVHYAIQQQQLEWTHVHAHTINGVTTCISSLNPCHALLSNISHLYFLPLKRQSEHTHLWTQEAARKVAMIITRELSVVPRCLSTWVWG